jgi:hypothetical protein
VKNHSFTSKENSQRRTGKKYIEGKNRTKKKKKEQYNQH